MKTTLKVSLLSAFAIITTVGLANASTYSCEPTSKSFFGKALPEDIEVEAGSTTLVYDSASGEYEFSYKSSYQGESYKLTSYSGVVDSQGYHAPVEGMYLTIKQNGSQIEVNVTHGINDPNNIPDDYFFSCN